MDKVLSFIKGVSPKAWIIISIVVVLIIILIVYIKNKNSENELALKNQQNLNKVSQSSVFPLVYGSRGEEVKKLQSYLNSKGESLVVDGIWGPLTNASVLKVLKTSSVDNSLFLTLK